MPGLYGAVGDELFAVRLRTEFQRVWSTGVSLPLQGKGAIGGHAFGGNRAVYDGDHSVLAVDGEKAFYDQAERRVGRLQSSSWQTADLVELTTEAVGSLAVVDRCGALVLLATDPTGTFPLYYYSNDGIFAFSSLIRPLAIAASAARNDLAALEFLRQAYVVGEKSFYHGIRRMLPGQVIRFRNGTTHVSERSEAWVHNSPNADQTEDYVEEAWIRLAASTERSLPSTRSAIMASGGWDSRTLIAVAASTQKNALCYSHGDMRSRELRLVSRICDIAGLPCHLEAIDERVLDADLLYEAHRLTENIVFPHWHRAAAVLEQLGVSCVAAGVYGEILGGHYGPAMLASSFAGKVSGVAGPLLAPSLYKPRVGIDRVREYLHVQLGTHWYLRREFEREIDSPQARMNSDIDAAVDRLIARGIDGASTIVEAFISENRGSQYINAQILSARSRMDVSLPFASRDIFTFSTQVPLDKKIHNKLNRALLQRHAPALLAEPMAATLVAARRPIVLQEISRAIRKAIERPPSFAKTVANRKRWGWVDFEFLGGSSAMHQLIEGLVCDFWNVSALHRAVDNVRVDPLRRAHPIYDQICKVLTVDRMYA